MTNSTVLERLNRIGLPPAYTDTWFAMHASAHLQATGIDARGRKQYRYHPEFCAMQDVAKFDQCLEFGEALPAIRRAVDRDLRRGDLSAERVLAAIVRLLDTAAIRIGNEGYAKENGSFGATTLRNRHAQVSGQKVKLSYVGKSGKSHKLTIADARLARLIRRCHDLPGQLLFQYVDAEGMAKPVTSSTVNEYLSAFGPFTAKNFRTWAASVIALEYLLDADGSYKLKSMIEQVASRLGNTPAIARKSYIHPILIEFAQGDRALPSIRNRATAYHCKSERALIHLLRLDKQATSDE